MSRGALRFKNMTITKQQTELARLRVVGGPDSGAVFVVTSPRVTVGRGEENDIILSDLKCSRKHLELTVGQGVSFLRDLGSSHGFMVNGVPYKQVQLKNGDKIGMGETVFEFIGNETGGTRLIVVPPLQVTSQVGTGTSGLTQFIPRPAGESSRAGSTGSGTFLERNKRLMLILGSLMLLAAMLPEVEQKQRAKKNRYIEPKEVEIENGLKALAAAKVDPNTARSADIQFKEGFREYRARNYIRAQVNFETALQIEPDHALAKIYLESTKKAMDEDAKEHFDVAKRDEEANRLHSAFQQYDAVRRIFFKDQSNQYFKDADKRCQELEKKIVEQEKD